MINRKLSVAIILSFQATVLGDTIFDCDMDSKYDNNTICNKLNEPKRITNVIYICMQK